MTEKLTSSKTLFDANHDQGRPAPERQARQFCTLPDAGIIVDMEIQTGDPVDSQIIRNFMGEFEQACKKR